MQLLCSILTTAAYIASHASLAAAFSLGANSTLFYNSTMTHALPAFMQAWVTALVRSNGAPAVA
jgi:hypothetical protein